MTQVHGGWGWRQEDQFRKFETGLGFVGPSLKTKGRRVRRDESEAMLGSDSKGKRSESSLKQGLKRIGSPGLIPPRVGSPVPVLAFEEARVDLVQADREPPLAVLLTMVFSLVSPAFPASRGGLGGTTNPSVPFCKLGSEC